MLQVLSWGDGCAQAKCLAGATRIIGNSIPPMLPEGRPNCWLGIKEQLLLAGATCTPGFRAISSVLSFLLRGRMQTAATLSKGEWVVIER